MSNECQCGQAHGACTTEFQYAVKVVCGEVVAQDNVPTPVAPGRYWTAINIHNPTKCQDAHFRWKVAVASPGQPGPISAFSRTMPLRPDEALEIDCPQIMKPFPSQKFIKGYVVIESDIELDVVAVYSGTPGACGSNSFHTERVQPRCVAVCEDLVLPLNTGFADWQTVSPGVGPVAVVSPTSGGWTTPPFGSTWVSEKSTDGNNAPIGTRIYELTFALCFGFTVPPAFPIQLLGDGSATAYLNGSPPLGPAAGWTAVTTVFVNPMYLQPGLNHLRIVVVNGGSQANPAGFAVAGTLRVIRGKCPCSPLPIAAQQHGPAGLEAQTDNHTVG